VKWRICSLTYPSNVGVCLVPVEMVTKFFDYRLIFSGCAEAEAEAEAWSFMKSQLLLQWDTRSFRDRVCDAAFSSF
jgi:hypothetical protein